MNNQQLSENQALQKIVRIFILQYLANVHNFKNVQNEAINMLATHVLRLVKNLVNEIKNILIMQGRTQPNCLHQLFAIKKLAITGDLQKFQSFVVEKKSKNIKFPHIFFQKTILKVFERDYQLANKYEKDKIYPTIRVIKNPYLFNFNSDTQCLPFKCDINEAFNRPPEFTYKNTVEKIEKEKKNVQSLIAFTRRQNRKALGLYLESTRQQERPRKKIKHNEEEKQAHLGSNRQIEVESKRSKQFDFIGFL